MSPNGHAFGSLVEDFDRGIDEIPTPAESVKAGLRKALFVHSWPALSPTSCALCVSISSAPGMFLIVAFSQKFQGLIIRYSYC